MLDSLSINCVLFAFDVKGWRRGVEADQRVRFCFYGRVSLLDRKIKHLATLILT